MAKSDTPAAPVSPEEEAAQHEEAVQEAAEQQEKAEEKRERQAARAAARKTNKSDEPPPHTDTQDGRTYRLKRLVDESQEILGVPSYVTAGALVGCEEEYLTIEGARDRVTAFEGREV